MKLKLLEIIGPVQKNIVTRLSRSLFGSEENSCEASSCSNVSQEQLKNTINPHAYLVAKQTAREIEIQKAFVTSLSRHERWKSGGPL